MDLEQFEELIKNARLSKRGPRTSSKTIAALRFHLVDGLSISEAARAGKITRANIYKALKNLPRKKCKCCGQYLPNDGAGK